MKSIYYYETEIGKLSIIEEGNFIINIFFENETAGDGIKLEETPLIKEANRQITEYFKNQRKIFELPLLPMGTSFQQKVWSSLKKIPYGETRSYKEIAVDIGNDKACRAVGMANNKNPIPILIPCHRVIGSNGKLIGYAGGVQIKEHLLRLEKSHI